MLDCVLHTVYMLPLAMPGAAFSVTMQTLSTVLTVNRHTISVSVRPSLTHSFAVRFGTQSEPRMFICDF